MKYKCLVLDHDDTIVNSTATVHYPSFVEYMKIVRPNVSFTLEEYVKYNFNPGVIPFFKDICGLSDTEMKDEQDFWMHYQKDHVSDAFPGLKEFLIEYKKQGGIIAVVSHSFSDKIIRDYQHNGLPQPDIIFGWERSPEEKKPSIVPILKIMEQFSLKKEDIFVLDDLKPGLDMAKKAGVTFGAACWCFDIKENKSYMKENADYYFESVEEFISHCK